MYILIPTTDITTPIKHAISNTIPMDSVFVSNIVNQIQIFSFFEEVGR